MKVQPDPDALPFPTSPVDQGELTDAAWNGAGNPASLIALLKGIYAQLAAINANTTGP